MKKTVAILALTLCVMHDCSAMLNPIRQNISRFGQYARQYVPQAAQTCRTFASKASNLRPQNFGWLRSMPTYARNVTLPSMRTAAVGLGGLGLGTAAYLQGPELFSSVKAEEESVAQEPKSRINEFKHFHYQSVFINDISKCTDRSSCTKDDLTYEIKAVETPEDIRLYMKNPRLIFDQPITAESEFVTDGEGKSLYLTSWWPAQVSEAKLQLPERLLPHTKIKYIKISDNEVELILPKIHSRFVPSWLYAQTIDVIKPQKRILPNTPPIEHIKTSDDE